MKIAAALLMLLVLFLLNTPADEQTEWDLTRCNVIMIGDSGGFPIREIQYSPDGTRLAIASPLGIWLLDVAPRPVEDHAETESTVRQWIDGIGPLTVYSSITNSVAFSPDGSVLASGSAENTVQVRDVKTGEVKWERTRHKDVVSSVRFSPDGKLLASGSWDGTLRLWDPKMGVLKGRLVGHTHLVTSVAFSPDGRALASGSADKTVQVWNAVTGEHR